MEVRCFYDDLQCTRGQLHNVPEDREDEDCWQDAELDDVLRVFQDRHCVKLPSTVTCALDWLGLSTEEGCESFQRAKRRGSSTLPAPLPC